MDHYVDLSHTIEEDMTVFKSLPKPKISTVFTHEESKKIYKKCTFEVTKIEFQTSLGTYIDSPYHRHPDLPDISMLKLSQTILDGVVIDVSNKKKFEPIKVSDLPLKNFKDQAVLFYTGWSQYWKKENYYESPFLSKEVVEFLIQKEVKLVGIDVLDVDSTQDEERPAHTLFLRKEILIVENLCNLEKLKNKEFTFFACPVKVKHAAAFPIRAFAKINP